MKYRLMDLLACPIDKAFPLKLTVIAEEKGKEVQRDKIGCELYCSFKDTMLKDPPADWVSNCRICIGINIKEAVLICPTCGRWYPVLEAIPRMLPDELRSRKDDEDFLSTFSSVLPKEVLARGPVGKA
ncbi:MAG: Trm112 family protein [Conexivisphaerales archaeon]